ncbi:SAC3 family protein B [Pelomyxa schiedti]|nr:SAC3 family protein B [Pelomyxa schiedti]
MSVFGAAPQADIIFGSQLQPQPQPHATPTPAPASPLSPQKRLRNRTGKQPFQQPQFPAQLHEKKIETRPRQMAFSKQHPLMRQLRQQQKESRRSPAKLSEIGADPGDEDPFGAQSPPYPGPGTSGDEEPGGDGDEDDDAGDEGGKPDYGSSDGTGVLSGGDDEAERGGDDAEAVGSNYGRGGAAAAGRGGARGGRGRGLGRGALSFGTTSSGLRIPEGGGARGRLHKQLGTESPVVDLTGAEETPSENGNEPKQGTSTTSTNVETTRESNLRKKLLSKRPPEIDSLLDKPLQPKKSLIKKPTAQKWSQKLSHVGQTPDTLTESHAEDLLGAKSTQQNATAPQTTGGMMGLWNQNNIWLNQSLPVGASRNTPNSTSLTNISNTTSKSSKSKPHYEGMSPEQILEEIERNATRIANGGGDVLVNLATYANQCREQYQEFSKAGPQKDYTESFVVGFCPTMCPRLEALERKFSSDLDDLEKIKPGWEVKRHKNSSPGEITVTVPWEIRPIHVLKMTMDHLVNNIVDISDESVSFLHVANFVIDRVRSIKTDASTQQCYNTDYVYILESAIRFMIVAQHRLCADPHYPQHDNYKQMLGSFDSLSEAYKYLKTDGIECPNKVEFILYLSLLSGQVFDLVRWDLDRYDLPELIFATQVVHTIKYPDWVAFFRLAKRHPSYLVSCCMHFHFTSVRTSALKVLSQINSGKSRQYPLSNLTDVLWFDNDEQTAAFCSNFQSLKIQRGEIFFSGPLQEPEKVDPCVSLGLEQKIGNRPLSTIIRTPGVSSQILIPSQRTVLPRVSAETSFSPKTVLPTLPSKTKKQVPQEDSILQEFTKPATIQIPQPPKVNYAPSLIPSQLSVFSPTPIFPVPKSIQPLETSAYLAPAKQDFPVSSPILDTTPSKLDTTLPETLDECSSSSSVVSSPTPPIEDSPILESPAQSPSPNYAMELCVPPDISTADTMPEPTEALIATIDSPPQNPPTLYTNGPTDTTINDEVTDPSITEKPSTAKDLEQQPQAVADSTFTQPIYRKKDFSKTSILHMSLIKCDTELDQCLYPIEIVDVASAVRNTLIQSNPRAHVIYWKVLVISVEDCSYLIQSLQLEPQRNMVDGAEVIQLTPPFQRADPINVNLPSVRVCVAHLRADSLTDEILSQELKGTSACILALPDLSVLSFQHLKDSFEPFLQYLRNSKGSMSCSPLPVLVAYPGHPCNTESLHILERLGFTAATDVIECQPLCLPQEMEDKNQILTEGMEWLADFTPPMPTLTEVNLYEFVNSRLPILWGIAGSQFEHPMLYITLYNSLLDQISSELQELTKISWPPRQFCKDSVLLPPVDWNSTQKVNGMTSFLKDTCYMPDFTLSLAVSDDDLNATIGDERVGVADLRSSSDVYSLVRQCALCYAERELKLPQSQVSRIFDVLSSKNGELKFPWEPVIATLAWGCLGKLRGVAPVFHTSSHITNSTIKKYRTVLASVCEAKMSTIPPALDWQPSFNCTNIQPDTPPPSKPEPPPSQINMDGEHLPPQSTEKSISYPLNGLPPKRRRVDAPQATACQSSPKPQRKSSLDTSRSPNPATTTTRTTSRAQGALTASDSAASAVLREAFTPAIKKHLSQWRTLRTNLEETLNKLQPPPPVNNTRKSQTRT